MTIKLNEDKNKVATIREGIKKRQGHCPCRLESTPDTLCMCKEFREQIEDPTFEGYCLCQLYYKTNK